MPSKEVTLDVASFLDSPQAKALLGDGSKIEAGFVKQVAEHFVALCYERLGKKPHLLDGQDVHAVYGHLLPERLARREPRADQVPAILEAYFEHLEQSQVVTHLFEIRRALQGTTPEFLETVATGHNAHHAGPKSKPFVHGAEKLGRNDPCSCGSGKKFKKCHGKGA